MIAISRSARCTGWLHSRVALSDLQPVAGQRDFQQELAKIRYLLEPQILPEVW